ncbi:MAG: hypothetical protein ACRD4E_03805 [Bryobacteraceae bacterium]
MLSPHPGILADRSGHRVAMRMLDSAVTPATVLSASPAVGPKSKSGELREIQVRQRGESAGGRRKAAKSARRGSRAEV